jgi:hypothetical protein
LGCRAFIVIDLKKDVLKSGETKRKTKAKDKCSKKKIKEDCMLIEVRIGIGKRKLKYYGRRTGEAGYTIVE